MRYAALALIPANQPVTDATPTLSPLLSAR